MDTPHKLVVFQDKNIRRIWYDEQWYFSVVVLSNNNNFKNHWSMLTKCDYRRYDVINYVHVCMGGV